jgi:hypothetical protein
VLLAWIERLYSIVSESADATESTKPTVLKIKTQREARHLAALVHAKIGSNPGSVTTRGDKGKVLVNWYSIICPLHVSSEQVF